MPLGPAFNYEIGPARALPLTSLIKNVRVGIFSPCTMSSNPVRLVHSVGPAIWRVWRSRNNLLSAAGESEANISYGARGLARAGTTPQTQSRISSPSL